MLNVAGAWTSQSLSDAFGTASFIAWLGAQFPQILENARRGDVEGLSMQFLMSWMAGDVANLVGCILTHQLPFQTAVATYFCFIDMCLMTQYFYYWRKAKSRARIRRHRHHHPAVRSHSTCRPELERQPSRASRTSQPSTYHGPHPAHHPHHHHHHHHTEDSLRALSLAAASLAELAAEAAEEASLERGSRSRQRGHSHRRRAREGEEDSMEEDEGADMVGYMTSSLLSDRTSTSLRRKVSPYECRRDPSVASRGDGGRIPRKPREPSSSPFRGPIPDDMGSAPLGDRRSAPVSSSCSGNERRGRTFRRAAQSAVANALSPLLDDRDANRSEEGGLVPWTTTTDPTGSHPPSASIQARSHLQPSAVARSRSGSMVTGRSPSAGRTSASIVFMSVWLLVGLGRFSNYWAPSEPSAGAGSVIDKRGTGRAWGAHKRQVGSVIPSSETPFFSSTASSTLTSVPSISAVNASLSSIDRASAFLLARHPASFYYHSSSPTLGIGVDEQRLLPCDLEGGKDPGRCSNLSFSLPHHVSTTTGDADDDHVQDDHYPQSPISPDTEPPQPRLPPEMQQPPPRSDRASTDRLIGRIFAWICTVLYLTSRLPQIWTNYTRQSVEGLSMLLFVAAFCGNFFYTLSILTSPIVAEPPPKSTEYLLESVPFLLGSAGTLLFDVIICAQAFLYTRASRKHHRGRRRRSKVVDEESPLLGGGERVEGGRDAMERATGFSTATLNAEGTLASPISRGLAIDPSDATSTATTTVTRAWTGTAFYGSWNDRDPPIADVSEVTIRRTTQRSRGRDGSPASLSRSSPALSPSSKGRKMDLPDGYGHEHLHGGSE